MHKTIAKYVIANTAQVNAISAAIALYCSKTTNASDVAYAQNAVQQFTQHKNVLTLFNALTYQDTHVRERVFYAIVNYCTQQKSATVNKFTFNYINTILDNFTLQQYS